MPDDPVTLRRRRKQERDRLRQQHLREIERFRRGGRVADPDATAQVPPTWHYTFLGRAI